MHPGYRRVSTIRFKRAVGNGLALFMSLVLPAQTLALSPPGKPGTGVSNEAVSRWPVGQQDASAKIHKAVADSFSAKGEATYLVKLRAKADVEAVAGAARKAAQPAHKEIQARTGVIQALKQTANSSQQSLVDELAKAQARGEVSRFEQFWVANLILVKSSRQVMEQVAKRSDVEQILPNSEIHLVKGPDNSITATPDTATTTGQAQNAPAVEGTVAPQSVEWGVQRVGAPQVWNTYGINGAGTVIASLDTGVDWTHPALHDRWRGYNPSTGETDPTYSWFDAVSGQAMPYDDHGHGTHTVGTAAGQDPEGQNQIGVAPGARWIGAKILSGSGSGTAEDILRAGQWVIAPGGNPAMAPDVVNNSWGGGAGIDEWFRDVVRAWRASGIFPAFAAGNSGPGTGTVSEPGNYPESFAVGATDISDNLASFSSRGPSPYDEVKPEVSAPGVNVRSSVPGGGYEGGWSGTSMATPHVAGTVALLRSADASLTVDQIEQILIQSADPKTNSQYPDVPNNGYGHGIVNAFTAVGMVTSGIGSVSGRVVTGGDDFEPPTIQHTPVTEGFKRLPIQVSATVADNVSVTSVQLRFRAPGLSWWGTVDMTRTSGDFHNGTYTGDIPPDMTQGSQVEYYIQATDYGGNTTYHGKVNAPHTITLANPLTPGYLQDFEGSATGWTHSGTNDPWQIGPPTSGPNSTHSGANVAATNLAGDYPSSAEAFLVSPPIDLSGGPAALRFWHWYDFEYGWDNGYVLGTGDGGKTWDILTTYTGEQMGWQEVSVDLSRYAGNPTIRLAFYISTDGSFNRSGWYIDDVEITVDHEAPPVPTGLTAHPTPTGAVALVWSAVYTSDLSHYSIYRSTTSGSGYTKLGDTANTAFVDTDVTSGTTYYYAVSASDIFGNESALSAEVSVTAPEAVTFFQDDMEAGAGDWTHAGSNDPWQWGVPTSGPNGAHSGTKLWATNLIGNYPSSANASLTTPPITLTGVPTAALQFAHWYSLESGFDYGFVEVTTDGGTTWNELARYTSPGYWGGQPVGWERPLLDLSSYVGQTIQIRFRLKSDSSMNYAGWYIDDVWVAGTTSGGMPVNLTFGTNATEPDTSLKGKPPEASKPQITLPTGQSGTVSHVQAAPATTDVGIQSLPLNATVTVVETGRVVRTDPSNGSYNLTLPAGTYTLRAEAYGYYAQDRSVTIDADSSLTAIFVLQPIPHGTIAGTVTNIRTGEPVAGATVSVLEDLRVAPATTGADGRFQLDVLEGSYTVQANARGYYLGSTSVSVAGGSTVSADLALEPFIGMSGEIAYDDGGGENAWAFYAEGNGWAVRMTPEHPGQTAMVTGARVYLWDESWPNPGGNSFQAAIYSANPDGSPGSLLAGPVRVTNAVRGAWNDVDFSQAGVSVTGDFYVVYIQDQPSPNTPGLAVDESTRDTGRNWQLVSGTWSPWGQGGNFMIRALVNYAVGVPTITSPTDGLVVNTPTIEVQGTGYPSTQITVYNQGTAAAETTADADGKWTASVTLTEGAQSLTATATVPGTGPGSGTTNPSAPVQVILDTVSPVLEVTAPTDNATQNSRIITVTGRVTDDHLASVTVGDKTATVGGDGQFTVELIGQEGENNVTVTATDRAGNSTAVTRRLVIDSQSPVITNMEPAQNREVQPGEVITLSFESEPNLALAAFQAVLDTSTTSGSGTAQQTNPTTLEPGEVAMREVSPGRYEASWTVPADLKASTVHIRFRAVDHAGNVTRETAPGTLTFHGNTKPTAVILAPRMSRVNEWVNVDGSQSSDPDGQIVSYQWEFGDGATGSGARARHKYSQEGTYTVRLTVTDDKGATGTSEVQLVVLRK